MNTCNTCRCNKVCNHDLYGFENCNNYIPTENFIPKTHFDRIKAMSIEEMAEYIYEHDDNLNDVICKAMYSECPWGDLVSPDNCLCCIKKWLESEVQEDEENIKS